MNILFVSDVSIADVIGGAERVLFEQSIRLVQREHSVHVLTRRLPTHKNDQEVIQGVREWRYDIDSKNMVSFFRTTQKNGRHLFESLHRRYRFDVINFHQPFSAFSVIESPFSQKIKKTYTCHSLSFEEYRSRNVRPDGIPGKIVYALNIHARKWIEKRVLNNSDAIIVLSRFTQGKLWDVYKIDSQKVSIIPGGVDLKRFRIAANKNKIRQRLNIPRGNVVLFSVRNLVKRMGLENLILAMKRLVHTAPDICLILGGEGPLKNDLIALAKKLNVDNHIRFIGFIPEEKLPDYYRMADLFVLPTREMEGFGLVTLEAMASGVPVLGTPVGGTREVLAKFDPGFLFKDTTPEAIASLIIENYLKIKETPQEWSEISHRCRRFVELHYSWEKNVDATEKIINRSKF